MSTAARRARGIGLALITGLGYAGCAATGTDSGITSHPTHSDAGSTGDEAGSGGESGAPLATTAGKGGLGDINTDSSAGAGGAPDDSCAADVSTAEVVPLDMYIMLDVSGSMTQQTGNGVTKWDAVKAALEAFIKDDSSAGLGVGIQYFPQLKPDVPASCMSDAECGSGAPCALKYCWNRLPNVIACANNADCNAGLFGGTPQCVPYSRCSANTDYACLKPGSPDYCYDETNTPIGTCTLVTDLPSLQNIGLATCQNPSKCDSASYAAPAEPIAALPDAAAALIASVDAQIPHGNTPTGPALTGAIKQASTWAKAHPERRVIAILATDGLPTECAPTTINEVAGIATNGLAATPSISTFVVGVFGQTDIGAGAAKNLDTIAKDGGTSKALIVYTTDDVTSQFLDALNTIRGTQLDCEFKIPQAKPGENLDYARVNVNFKNVKDTSTLLYVGSADNCDPLNGGWYYDTDPSLNDPSKILVCDTTCTTFKAAKGAGSVSIAVGCQTVVK